MVRDARGPPSAVANLFEVSRVHDGVARVNGFAMEPTDRWESRDRESHDPRIKNSEGQGAKFGKVGNAYARIINVAKADIRVPDPRWRSAESRAVGVRLGPN